MRYFCSNCGNEMPELKTDGDEVNRDLICQSCYEEDSKPWLKDAINRLHDKLRINHLP